MPSKNKQYNLVQSDDLDSRIPLMPEEAFQHGIPFNCKFIGSMDIPRPTSRVEIVAAMRRVRVEFKSKGVKKKKITLTISVDGIKTSLRKKNRKRKKLRNSSAYVDVDGNNSMVIVSHPIYRIFYVSHDSQDVKIFSYIARETSSNVFHCCVFKAANKNQAMRIVRTVGQAFEVCHKLVGTAGEEDESEEVNASDTNLSSQLDSKLTDSGNKTTEDQLIVTTPSQQAPAVVPPQPEPVLKKGSSNSLIGENAKAASSSSNTSTPPAILASALTPLHGSDNIPESASIKVKPKNLDLTRRDNNISTNDLMNLTTPSSSAVPTPTQSQSFFKEISLQPNSVASSLGINNKGRLDPSNKENLAQVHEAQLLKEQLDQQTQNTRAALAQIQLLRDQLAAESAARIEAQARTHQLLIHNKELLDHLQTLVRHIQELEATTSGGKGSMSSNNSIAAATAAGVTLPQVLNNPPQHRHSSHSGHHHAYPSNSSPNNTPPPSTLPISFQEIEALRRQNAALLETLIYENNARSNTSIPAAAYFPALAHQRYAGAFPYGYAPQLGPPPPTSHHLLYSSPFANASTSLIMTNNNNNNSNQSQSSSTSSSRGLLCGDLTTSSSEMLATIFTSSGQAIGGASVSVNKDQSSPHSFLSGGGSPFIRPLEQDQGNNNSKLLLAPPPTGFIPKLGQIGRNASADYEGGSSGAFDEGNLRRNVLGRSVSEKIGHRSELMSQVQRTAWARHTTK